MRLPPSRHIREVGQIRDSSLPYTFEKKQMMSLRKEMIRIASLESKCSRAMATIALPLLFWWTFRTLADLYQYLSCEVVVVAASRFLSGLHTGY
jgi:hypothetical protein